MSQIHVFTSAAFNYIPKVRMLFNSIRKFHPEWRLHLVLADELREDIDLSNEPFDEICAASNLNIPDWLGWAYCHSIVELATAIKPFMLAKLLGRPECKCVIYLDPDTVLFSRLDDIVDALENANIVLTPHQICPEESLEAIMDNEISSLKHGIYNLGFIGVSASDVGKEFASWWGSRTYHFCRADIPNGLFTDQRWIDLAPAFFSGVAVMRSSRHNVAPWNLTTRELSLANSGQYLVDGEPLGFYHFTGFDSGAHSLMAEKNANKNNAVQQIIKWYTNQINALAQDPLAKVAWAYGSHTNGILISKAHRLVYRERTDLQVAFSNPFDSNTYIKWWNTQGKIEYPDFFDDKKSDIALAKLSATLSPGFVGKSGSIDWRKLGFIFRKSFSEPATNVKNGKHFWEIMKSEGVGGLKRRISTNKK